MVHKDLKIKRVWRGTGSENCVKSRGLSDENNQRMKKRKYTTIEGHIRHYLHYRTCIIMTHHLIFGALLREDVIQCEGLYMMGKAIRSNSVFTFLSTYLAIHS